MCFLYELVDKQSIFQYQSATVCSRSFSTSTILYAAPAYGNAGTNINEINKLTACILYRSLARQVPVFFLIRSIYILLFHFCFLCGYKTNRRHTSVAAVNKSRCSVNFFLSLSHMAVFTHWLPLPCCLEIIEPTTCMNGSLHEDEAGYGVPPGTTRFVLSFLHATAATCFRIISSDGHTHTNTRAWPKQIKSLQFSPKRPKTTRLTTFYACFFSLCIFLRSFFPQLRQWKFFNFQWATWIEGEKKKIEMKHSSVAFYVAKR